MDLRQLEYVVAVAEERSFTRAAARCHVVQSALSAQVARLERELGVTLFHRTSRSVRVAPAGELLLPHARELLRGAEVARAELAGFSGVVTGRLRLGVIGTAAMRLPRFDRALLAFHQRHPAVEIAVHDTGSRHMAEAVRTGDLDLAFVGLYAEQLPPGLVHHLLADEPLVAVVAPTHPLAGRDGVALDELAATGPFIEMRRESGLRLQADAAFDRAAVERTVAFELGTPDAVARYAGLGLGAGLVPASTARAAARVAVLRLDDPTARHPIGLVHRAPAPSTPSARAFLAVVLGTGGESPGRAGPTGDPRR
ncbi:DNA-binding transcriptional regulator, LysR family [Geodermatophilus siccatus]|uniref:DNA-binding transcriptional regulator, LysR family n=1 Tax=Geodermatophilus siccatus TaxID=1137991 RepID=A0A1G9QKQ2_9ACTN|nr:LysR family transcriptional regulator [Geodermatophilus siccatus]SDM11569.1 DNA-binding transcriptional regulator, LysR family [Geodermatophilus siccatus]